jgi:hypothetical protein
VVTLAQLFDAGLDKDSVGRRVEVGRLHRLHRGVYAVGHVRLDPAGVWLAGVLAAGEGAVLSHQSAASLWGLVGPLLLPVHVTAPTHRTSRPGLRIHRSRSLTEDEITTRNRIPVTTPLRTIRDLPPHLKPAARREAIVTRLIDRTPTDTPTRSNPERRFLRRIRALALPEPECNVAVEGRELTSPGARSASSSRSTARTTRIRTSAASTAPAIANWSPPAGPSCAMQTTSSTT